jgi:hypothetical protein
MKKTSEGASWRRRPLAAGLVAAGVLPWLAGNAQAMEFGLADEQIKGSLDTTLSFGQLWRVQGQDKHNDDVNTNDGNRNFDTGLVSEVFKLTSELELSYKNYGLFIRGSAFYDTQIMGKRNNFQDHALPAQPSQNTPRNNSFTRDTRNSAGHDIEILDAYVRGNWDMAGAPLDARLGRQVFNWGEGLFYRGGVNTTNPIDAASFRLPGSELKEVLVPVEALSFNLGLGDDLSVETFYQFNWKETQVDPVGTYFSETDLFAAGGNTAYAPVPALIPVAGLYQSLGAAGAGGLQGGGRIDPAGNLKAASIGPDINARNDGQYGIALRYMAEQLNATEFGLYFVNYHAKEPTIHADLGTFAGLNLAEISAAAAPQVQQAVAAQAGITVARLQQLIAADPNGPLAQAYRGALGSAVGGAATLDVASHVRGRRQYAEDIRMLGVSFNTHVGQASVFGELAYRPNMPIGQASTSDLLGDLLSQAPQLASGRPVNIGGHQVTIGGQIRNAERVEMFSASLGSVYNLGPRLSFDGMSMIAELSSEHLRGSSLKYSAWDGTTRYYAGRGNGSYVAGYDRGDMVNRNAYGYTLMLQGAWNDVYAGVNLSPFAVFKHDFEGNSHQTGNFIEGRKAHTLGLKTSYQNRLETELQYTAFYGGGRNNAVRDRDNVGVNVKYSF